MATLNISIPDAIKRHIDVQVDSGAYTDASDYIGDLVRHDAQERDAVLVALAEGEASGVSKLTPDALLEELLRARIAA